MWRFLRMLIRGTFVFVFSGRVFGQRYEPRSGGALLVSNHQSFFDPVLVGLPLRRETAFMARDSLFKGRFGRLIRYLNAFPVRRSSADIGAIKDSLRRLKSGEMVVVFPEGTRTIDGGVAPMQPGISLLARRARVPIVPTLILGAYEAWPRHRKFPLPHPITVAYAEPLTAEQIAGLSDEACIEEVRRRIVEMKQRHERRARQQPPPP
jgi:1-acyl-sn-glycerol-3-phosphate acyltransferase